ncbi:MAG: Crp/Fnr family transcriptional regulator [Methylococcales bacterium]|nr:Crp/Fnr family transcriptional regulator [Methylococcales bacterium]
MSNQVAPTNNRLLAALPRKDREQLLAHCEQIDLVFAEELYLAGDIIPYVYFPTGSFVSLMAPLNSGENLEMGLIGNEGMFGISLMLGVDVAPFHAMVQGAGPALRITATSFLRELEQSPALQLKLKHYLYVSMSQLAQRAVCTRFHLVKERLARWLLMAQDRVQSDSFHATHTLMAHLLGVRRVGITKAANSLQKQKLINYQRGDITILDRVGLEAASCGCYRINNETYERILG